METSEVTQLHLISPPGREPAPASSEFQSCDECDTPVDRDQRYCVNCGAHRRNVPDPAARFLSRATAQSRGVGSSGLVRRSGAGRRGVSLTAALVLALLPVTAAIGVEVGRSSDGQDSKLIQELARERAQMVVPSATTTASGSTTSTHAGAKSSKTAKKGARAKAVKRAATAGGKVVSRTSYGAVTQIAGSKVTAGEAQQGAAEAKTIQNSTGKSYVQAANNLPTTVVP